MNTVIMLCVMTISLSIAAPTLEDAEAKILSYENDNNGKGNYEFSFETSNGISRKESGRLVNVGEPDEHLEVQGVYSYTDAKGKLVVVRYTADENGYNVEEGSPQLFMEMMPTFMPLPPMPPVLDALPPAAVATLLG